VSASDPGPGQSPSVAETHISILFLVGDRVYKLRKPVRFGFLDFTSREAREADCHREVALNRRLAPDVYLGVADVVAAGAPIDHLVVMRRMPEGRRLAALVRQGEDVTGCVRSLARALASFHASARRSDEIDEAASPEALLAGWEANFAETAPFVGPVLDPEKEQRLQAQVRRYLAGRGPLLRHRIAQGQVCDGHGDLQAEDVFCLDDGPRVLDCIEFDDRLRYADVLADVSFLAMDLVRLGAPAASRQLLADYQELSGVRFPGSLASHYCAARAYVRAKVACLRGAQGDHWAVQAARGLQELCLSYLEAAAVRMVLVGGLPGTGKSTLARGLADALDAVVLRSDELRRELSPEEARSPAADSGYRQGRYRPEVTAATYRTMLERARVALEQGESVVLDATWQSEAQRRAAREVAGETSSEVVDLACVLPPPEAHRRIEDRRARGEDLSEATVAAAEAMAADADPWPSALVLDTSGSKRDTLRKALEAFPFRPVRFDLERSPTSTPRRT
jgi:aminoglycoside phosphotransferase family enzyme/predicted kinase